MKNRTSNLHALINSLFSMNHYINFELSLKSKRKNDINGGGKIGESGNQKKEEEKSEKQPKKKMKKRFTKTKLGRKGKRRHGGKKKGMCIELKNLFRLLSLIRTARPII